MSVDAVGVLAVGSAPYKGYGAVWHVCVRVRHVALTAAFLTVSCQA